MTGTGRSKAGCWIEAMRLRTLPVSLAGVLYAAGLGVATGFFSLAPALMCLTFALLAQIASNFANEYYDFKAGLDRAGREGPRRGVTEGDITPAAMKYATYATLGAACAVGCVLVAIYGEWWMYVVGILTALGVMAYSTGPYPLSHHGLGEVAVVCFFGIIPVCLTYILMGGPYQYGAADGLDRHRADGRQCACGQQLPRCRRRPRRGQTHARRHARAPGYAGNLLLRRYSGAPLHPFPPWDSSHRLPLDPVVDSAGGLSCRTHRSLRGAGSPPRG